MGRRISEVQGSEVPPGNGAHAIQVACPGPGGDQAFDQLEGLIADPDVWARHRDRAD
jgi:hypothetical protein